MKRTCNNCKALDSHKECMLGFRNQNCVPFKECPKPNSWKQFDCIKKDIERRK